MTDSTETPLIHLLIDGQEVTGRPGQTILEAADGAGIYIPRLCWLEKLTPFGACRVCVVRANGRIHSACTLPIVPGMVVENDTEELRGYRRNLIDMLFAEGNHFCMFCEKSGSCELQALAYRFGITAPKYPGLFRNREIDASHPDILIDRNRCVLCARCVRASKDADGKGAFGFAGRSIEKRLVVSAAGGLAGTTVSSTDAAIAACPTGTLIRKRTGYAVPVGERRFDHIPIGAEIEHQTDVDGATNAEDVGTAPSVTRKS
ncbi:MAG: 2Fe-2S iron-sulfur cluster-binding protein [Candidatus Eisenbacteria bacterium]